MATTVNITQERIELTALDKGAAAAIKGVSGALGSMRAGLDSVNGALAAVGVTLGAGAMLALAKDVIAADAALDDMAESTGASVERLSALRRVAQVGGHDFEGLTAQIGKTIKGLRENAEEGGKAARAFEAVGVKTRDANGNLRDMGEVMVEFAQALDKYQDGATKTALVQDALGRGAERYIPLLKDVAEGTDLVATTTARQAAEAEAADKAWKRFMVTLEDNRRVMVREYTPALRELLEQLAEGTRLAGGFFAALGKFGTMSPFASPGENAATQRQVIEQLTAAREQLSRMPGYEGAIGNIDRELVVARQRLEFAKFMERQRALAGAGDENLDARDLAARGGSARGRLDYQPTDAGSDAKILREAEFRAAKQVELEEMAAQDSREAWDFYTKGRLTQEAELRKGQEQMMRDWFALIDQEQADAIERGQEYLDSETNRREEWYAEQLNLLVSAREQGLLTEEEFHARRVDLEVRHQERLTGVANTAAMARLRFTKSTMLQQAQTIFGELANITAGVAQHNKFLFQVNKTAAIANAIMNAYTGISKTLASYPYPWNLALAALHGVAAFAQVNAIRATSFEGGGAGAAPSVAGTTAATPVSPVETAAPAAGGQARTLETNVVIVTRGSPMARAVAEEIAQGLNDLHKDGFPMTFAVKAA